MKKIFTLILACLTFAGVASAQSDSFKSFRVDAGLLYAMPGGDALDAGVGYYLNPKFHITDNVLLGAKLEGAVMGSADEDAFDVSAVVSYAATFDYYFNTNSFRPFIGADAGIYSLGNVEFEGSNEFATIEGEIDLGSKFGFAPKVGFSYGHFDLALQYNFIMGQEDGYDEYNYFSIKMGFHFGGGKK
ncbi:outer membrane beta-barrel protein [Marinifilum flexuosum]|uniref:outer membrane beta-barrel protein n=1 Tax=Marinifilum flexuosum TaxID=1117708 RepID=UPI002494701E|nr:outer membrane beta-barrel protein [Marinifilum flexuosum]